MMDSNLYDISTQELKNLTRQIPQELEKLEKNVDSLESAREWTTLICGLAAVISGGICLYRRQMSWFFWLSLALWLLSLAARWLLKKRRGQIRSLRQQLLNIKLELARRSNEMRRQPTSEKMMKQIRNSLYDENDPFYAAGEPVVQKVLEKLAFQIYDEKPLLRLVSLIKDKQVLQALASDGIYISVRLAAMERLDDSCLETFDNIAWNDPDEEVRMSAAARLDLPADEFRQILALSKED